MGRASIITAPGLSVPVCADAAGTTKDGKQQNCSTAEDEPTAACWCNIACKSAQLYWIRLDNFRGEVHYMKRYSVLFSLFAFCVLMGAGALLRVHGQGRGPSPEAQARQKQQLELEAATPKLMITEEVLPLVTPGHTI